MKIRKAASYKAASLVAIGCLAVSQISQANIPKSNKTQTQQVSFGSDYTSLKNKSCKMLEMHEQQEGYYRQKCPAVKGYGIEAEGGDLRNWLNVKAGNKTVSYRNMNFSSFGDKAEWRYRKIGAKKVYHALIYRMYEARQNPKTGEILPQSQDKQSLIVIQLDPQKPCVLGVVAASPTMNSQARQLADNLRATCPASLNQNQP